MINVHIIDVSKTYYSIIIQGDGLNQSDIKNSTINESCNIQSSSCKPNWVQC